jgi:hypothetical protein
MSQMSSSSFDLLTRLITVRDLAQPLYGRFDVSESIAHVLEGWIEDWKTAVKAAKIRWIRLP